MIVGVNTEAIAGEGLILTAGGFDAHVHFICPQVCKYVHVVRIQIRQILEFVSSTYLPNFPFYHCFFYICMSHLMYMFCVSPAFSYLTLLSFDDISYCHVTCPYRVMS